MKLLTQRDDGSLAFVDVEVGGGSVDLAPIIARLDEHEADLDVFQDMIEALQAGGGAGLAGEWIDVTRHFHLEYRSSPGINVLQGRYNPELGVNTSPVLSVGYYRLSNAFWVDAYVRFGDGCTAYKDNLTEGARKNGWDLVCYDPSLYPVGASGGFGICQIHSADPHEGDNTTGKAHWEQKPDGKWAIIPHSTPLGVSGGNFTWLYPEQSGHAIWEFPGSFFRIVMGPCRRRV